METQTWIIMVATSIKRRLGRGRENDLGLSEMQVAAASATETAHVTFRGSRKSSCCGFAKLPLWRQR